MKPKRKSGSRNHDSHPGVLIKASKRSLLGNDLKRICLLELKFPVFQGCYAPSENSLKFTSP